MKRINLFVVDAIHRLGAGCSGGVSWITSAHVDSRAVVSPRAVGSVGGALLQFFSLFLSGGASKYRAIKAAIIAKAMLAAAAKTTTGIFICHYREMMELIKNQ